MFTPLIESINRTTDSIKLSAPHFMELIERWVGATERQARATQELANAVTLIANVRELNSYEREER